ncbi:MAG TPA: ATP-binding protein [Moraxellaceae bacterium]|nr:ATP-binding protein [Moraxellaceae bacterium]
MEQTPATRPSAAARVRRLAYVAVSRMHPLIQLRWLAVGGQVATILFVHVVLEIPLPLKPMMAIVAGLVAFNLFSMVRWRHRDEVSDTSVFLALLLDVLTLTALLHYSGGAGNPFIFLYLLQVVLAAVLLPPWGAWAIAAITGAGFAALTVWPGPVILPLLYTAVGLFLCFLLNAALIVIFINRITRMLRARDENLAAMRQRAAEEEHIVRMGLLASGAAHELGTPLATISVLLNDWRRMKLFREQADLLEESAEMQLQLDRCKSIVSGILLSAGETRAEAPQRTSLTGFFDALVENWKATRPLREFRYEHAIEEDLPIVADEGLKQMICNVLDNARDASPEHVTLAVHADERELVVRVLDEGPGFTPAMLAQFGRPYHSTKGRPGSGLGLFLSLNVARGLGGNIFAQNRDRGGAVVTMVLPLAALVLDEEDDDDD